MKMTGLDGVRTTPKKAFKTVSNDKIVRLASIVLHEVMRRPNMTQRMKSSIVGLVEKMNGAAKEIEREEDETLFSKANAPIADIPAKIECKVEAQEEGAEARSFRIRRDVLARLDVAAAIVDERIGDFVTAAIAERIDRLENRRGSKFPPKDIIR